MIVAAISIAALLMALRGLRRTGHTVADLRRNVRDERINAAGQFARAEILGDGSRARDQRIAQLEDVNSRLRAALVETVEENVRLTAALVARRVTTPEAVRARRRELRRAVEQLEGWLATGRAPGGEA